MKLRELDAGETLALVALMQTVVLSDGKVSPAEAQAVPRLVEEIGDDRYRRAFTAATQQLAHESSLKAFLGAVRRPAARAIIYETVMALARTDGVVREERRLLDWLASAWQLDVG